MLEDCMLVEIHCSSTRGGGGGGGSCMDADCFLSLELLFGEAQLFIMSFTVDPRLSGPQLSSTSNGYSLLFGAH